MMSSPVFVVAAVATAVLLAALLARLRKRLQSGQLVVASLESVAPISRRLVLADISMILAFVSFIIAVPALVVLVLLDFYTRLDVNRLWYEALVSIPGGLGAVSFFLSLHRANP